MRLVIRRRAKRDLDEARRWYDERQPGLGQEFLSSVEAALALISDFPLISPKVDPRVRRARTERFPFGIFYVVDEQVIRVIAVLHNARSPFLWKSRAEDE